MIVVLAEPYCPLTPDIYSGPSNLRQIRGGEEAKKEAVSLHSDDIAKRHLDYEMGGERATYW